MRVSVIVPVYNGERYIGELFKKVREQSEIEWIEIIAPVSKSHDRSLELAEKYADKGYPVEEFNHGMTRYEAACRAEGEYLVFITQDMLPVDSYWMHNLLKNLDNETIAAFSRQIAFEEHGKVEKLIREFNYPLERRVCNYENREKNGRKNIFFSNVASGILKDEYMKLGGHNFFTPTNEDVVFANRIIMAGKTFLYEPESKVYHSHKLSFADSFKRYASIGKFEFIYGDIIDFSKTGNEGKKLVKTLMREGIRELNIKFIYEFIVQCSIRILGYKAGYYGERFKSSRGRDTAINI